MPLPQTSRSLWFDKSADDGTRPGPLPQRTDVAIVGAGIAGLTTAVLLARAGVSVTVIDTRGIARGATGHSTAKVSIVHELAYSQISSTAGAGPAQAYATGNQHGLRWIRDRVHARHIRCDWEDQPGLTFVVEERNRSKIRDEVAAYAAAGVDATMVEPAFPFPSAAAVRVDGQGQFDPVPWTLDLAAEVQELGGTVVTGVRATGVDDGATGAKLRTDAGDLPARWVLAATGLPFLDRGGFFARAEPQASYIIACRVEQMPPPGTYLAADSSAPSLRTAVGPDGQELLLVGGESHKTGQGGSTLDHYQALERWTAQNLGVQEITHRFMTEDFMTPDHIPFAGPLHRGRTSVLVATGFNKWGFTSSVACAEVNAAHVTGEPLPSWADAYSSLRLPTSGFREIAKANANVGKHLIGGWAGAVARRGEPAPGEGEVVWKGVQPVAISTDAAGRRCAVSGVCTHLGGIVTWNDAEETWDCPLHGSRFERGGTLRHGPATRDLHPKG